MAIVTNTFTTYDDKRKRETFSDIISMLSPEETPFRSMIGKRTITGTHPEWSNDALADPNAANAVPEGDEYTFGAVTGTTKLGNYAQISRKDWIVSDTDEAVEKAGQKSELARQKLKKGNHPPVQSGFLRRLHLDPPSSRWSADLVQVERQSWRWRCGWRLQHRHRPDGRSDERHPARLHQGDHG
jgi:hypothetical protein